MKPFISTREFAAGFVTVLLLAIGLVSGPFIAVFAGLFALQVWRLRR